MLGMSFCTRGTVAEKTSALLGLSREASFARTCLVLILAVSFPSLLPAQGPVAFDTDLLVAAEALPQNAGNYGVLSAGKQLVWTRLRISTQIPFNVSSSVNEITFRLQASSGNMKVVDYWPRTEVVSPIDGNIDVAHTDYQHQYFSLQAIGGSPAVAGGRAVAGRENTSAVQQTYQERPTLNTQVSSGTIDRARGVYFQLRPSPQMTLEGGRDFWVLWEVSANWKADLLDVSAQATALKATHSQKLTSLGYRRFLVALYQAQDEKAYQNACRYVEFEGKLRQSASAYDQVIKHQRTPTPWHRIAQSIDLIESEIPAQWLDYVLYNKELGYIDSKTAKLPVDVRVAILDYIDQRQALLQLASVY
jgi:hypothetical protein